MEFNQITDTPPHIQKLLIEGYLRMSPQQKLKRVGTGGGALDSKKKPK